MFKVGTFGNDVSDNFQKIGRLCERDHMSFSITDFLNFEVVIEAGNGARWG